MADETINTNTPVTEDTSSSQSEVNFNDPFDFSEGAAEDSLSLIEFNLDEEGEIKLEGLEEIEGEESVETQETSTTEEVKEIKEDEGYVTDPFLGQKVSPEVQAVLDRNKELEERLAKLEGTVTESSAKEQLAKREAELREKYERVGFTDEQIDVLVEDALAVEAKNLREKEDGKKEETPNQEVIGREIGEVIQYYNGKNGRPSVEEMKPFANYSYMRFGEALKKYPIITTFRLGENAPFINWLDRTYPNEMKNLSLEQIFTASENLRKAYYQKRGKPVSSYDHLRMVGEEKNQNTNNGHNVKEGNISNEDVIRLSNEKNETSRNVPGGEVETEEEVNERRRPRSARETAETTLTALMGGK